MKYLVSQAIKNLYRERSFSISIVATLAIVLGLLICIATLAYVVLIKPLPYPEANRLYQVQQQQIKHDGAIDNRFYTYPGLLHLYKTQQIFDKTALIFNGEEVITSLAEQPRVSITYITPEWFTLFNVPMAVGRAFTDEENLYQFKQSAIISHTTWQTLYDGDLNILNRQITIKGKSYNIVGVVGRKFSEPTLYANGSTTQVFLPFDFHPYAGNEDMWGRIIDFRFIGALNTTEPVELLEQQLAKSATEIWQENTQGISFLKGWHLEMKLQPLKSVIIGETEKVVYLLLASVIGLVVISVANLTNVFVARTAQRRHVLSITAALGAKKGQVFNAFLIEAMVLMLTSLLMALVIAKLGFTVLQRYFVSELPRLIELSLNSVSVAVAVFSLAVLSLFFAIACLNSIDFRQLTLNLQSGGKGQALQVSSRVRKVLIASQIMVAAMLLFCSVGLFKQAIDELAIDIGVETDQVYSLRLSYASEPVPERAYFADVMKQISILFSQQPEIDNVSHSSSPLLRFGQWPIFDVDKELRYTTFVKAIDERYFDILNQPVIAGRSFSEEDLRTRANVWVINKALADYLAPNGSAIGYQVVLDTDNIYTVVGVVNNIHQPNQEGQPFRIYLPGRYYPQRLLIKFNRNQAINHARLTELIQQIDHHLVILDYHALSDKVNEQNQSQRVTLVVTAAIALYDYFIGNFGCLWRLKLC